MYRLIGDLHPLLQALCVLGDRLAAEDELATKVGGYKAKTLRVIIPFDGAELAIGRGRSGGRHFGLFFGC